MEPFRDAFLLDPQWVQPKMMKSQYELRAVDCVFATLEFPKFGGSLAIARTTESSWSFKRAGFFQVRITVRREGDETDQAIYKPRWTGIEGTLELFDGTNYVWKSANFWSTHYLWQDTQGNPLVTFKEGAGDTKLPDLFKCQARVEVQPQARMISNLSLLVPLGFYLLILKQQDDAAVVS